MDIGGFEPDGALFAWLKANTEVIPTEEGSSWMVVTPFFDRHNDGIVYFVDKGVNGFRIHDNGRTIVDLAHSGCDVTHGKRKELMERCLNQTGIELSKDGILQIFSAFEDVGSIQAVLIKCITDLNGLALLTRSTVAQMFSEDVKSWLSQKHANFQSDISVRGQGYEHHFDFLVKSDTQRTYCRTLQSLNKATSEKLALTTYDLRPKLQEEAKQFRQELAMAVIYDDRKKPLKEKSKGLIEDMGFRVVGWRHHEDLNEILALP